jgi:gliding motility-associated-like protein
VIVGCPSNITVNANASCQAVVSWAAPTFTDNCSGGTLTSTKQPGSSFNLGSTTVSYTATDGVGNIATCSFKVIVQDKSGPVFENCITDIVVNANSTCSAIVNWGLPQVTDNCGSSIVTSSHKPGDTFPIGKTEVKYAATDSHGNVSTCTFNVIVKNEILPTISNCPTDIFLKGNEANVATADWIIPTASVPCGEVTMTGSHQPGDFKVGTTKIEYKATDDAGNTSSCYFNVIVAEMEIEIDIAKMVTPDGNGINDEWIVTNIEKFGDNKVVVVDRWGGVVFSGSGYNNKNIVWRGTNGSGRPVPTGTYFYTISVRFGEQSVEKSGFIEVIQ